MDEIAFRAARGEINRLPCVFEKALLRQCAVCSLALQHSMAERPTVACTAPVARAWCGQLAGLLREKSAFALKMTDMQRPLPHAQILKIQCGGLRGLQRCLDPDAPAPDVQRLIKGSKEQYTDLTLLPFSEIVKEIAAWQNRRRRPLTR